MELHSVIKQSKIWIILASVLPLTALSGIFFLEFIGRDNLITISLVIGAVMMFLFAVIWWWWAIYTISKFAVNLSKTIEKFDDVKKDLKEIRKDFQD